MRFVLNTKNLDAAASLVCIKSLSRLLVDNGFEATVNDWENYQKYDVAVFMAHDAQIDEARKQNPNILIGLADPKPGSMVDAQKADFLLVGSLEQRELFLKQNRNIFIYYMVPEFDSYHVRHCQKSRTKIFYHGNKVHLNASYENLTPALNALGEKYDIELCAIYNIEKLGLWKVGRPDPSKCPVTDLQWYENCYKDYFRDADIGLVQNLYPIRFRQLLKKYLCTSRTLLLESPSDHIVKYKSSANAGRAFIFGYFNIPVVAEAIPSTCDVIRDNYSGRLVLSAEGWYDALEDLILSYEKRAFFAKNFRKEIEGQFSKQAVFERFISFLKTLRKKEAPHLRTISPRLLTETVRERWHYLINAYGKLRTK